VLKWAVSLYASISMLAFRSLSLKEFEGSSLRRLASTLAPLFSKTSEISPFSVFHPIIVGFPATMRELGATSDGVEDG